MTASNKAAAPHPPLLAQGDALFVDFDGTLVEIAATPDRIEIAADLSALLQRVASRLDGAFAVISGRPLADLTRRLVGYSGAVAGNHGLERRSAAGIVHRPRADPTLELVWPAIRQFAALTPGVTIEDKGLAIAIHYRGRPELAETCRRVAERAVLLSENQLTMLTGKMVIELRPRGVDKGHAAQAFLAEPEFRNKRPVFVGDDWTDEAGFAVANRLDGIAIHVGDGKTIARYRLDSVAAVIRWLEAFLAAT
ncbi:MAG TPA: trehalose-phosphatase [Casimicrobiaceae bacterium]